MKKAYFFSAGLLFLNSLTAQVTLQTVTDNGNATTNQIIVSRTDDAFRFNATNNVDADLILGVTAPGATTKYAWLKSSISGRNLILNPDNGGNVGIGTATPSTKLQVNGDFSFTSEYNHIVFPLSVGYSGGITGDDGNYKKLVLFHGNSISFETGLNEVSYNNTRMLIDNAGNVGIGTTTPGTYKLAVEGTIGARKIKVTQETPWADYVFDSSYQLQSLNQVESYIQQNKHLPEVPSASEVKKDGIDLGDNQVILLKKVEELTLYIIQQNKKIQDLEKRLTEIETKK